MGSVGQQMLSGYGQMLGVASHNKKGDNMQNLLMELEIELMDTRKELELCKKDAKQLTKERNKVS